MCSSTMLRCKILLLGFIFANLVLKFASSSSQKVLDVQEIITNLTHLISTSNNDIAKRMEKFEIILMQMMNKTDEIKMQRESDDVVSSALTLHCLSTCKAKVATWANRTGAEFKTSIENADFWNATTTSVAQSLNVCDPNPCFYGGTCQLNSSGSDFNCVQCPKLTSGKLCENVNCTKENSCWKHRDTLYVVFETELTWAEAKVMCEKEGMSMAMPQEQESSEFLVSQLKHLKEGDRNGLWIGLMRDDVSGWRWVDGSGLGSYTGGRNDMKSAKGTFFAALLLDNRSGMWAWTSIATTRSYPLCEIRRSTNSIL